jgi:hypothetical protein
MPAPWAAGTTARGAKERDGYLAGRITQSRPGEEDMAQGLLTLIGEQGQQGPRGGIFKKIPHQIGFILPIKGRSFHEQHVPQVGN